MKVLFLPINIASQQAISAHALNRIGGVESKCLTRELSKYNSINDSVIYLPEPSIKISRPFSSIRKYYQYRSRIKKWIMWADVLHYVWGPVFKDGKDLEWAANSKKPIFVEWVGSDIRSPEILIPINPYYKGMLSKGYEYKDIENGNYKDKVQVLFAKFGAVPTVLPEMSLFLRKDLFPRFLLYPHRLNVRDYLPEYPTIHKKKPLIVHSPTVKIGKGSDIIIGIIEQLRIQYDFDFVLLHQFSRNEVQELMKSADIFIDQIIVGGYGMSSCEAMAFGKPVVCYLMNALYDAGLPEDCPIVNASPDNLRERLIMLITNSELRHEVGKKSRAFVERYNDSDKIAADYLRIYRETVSARKK